MNKQVDLVYKLEGPAIEEGLNVHDLAPMLLNVANLIQTSNRLLRPSAGDVGVNIKPFKNGSFVIEIVLFAQTGLQQVIGVVNSNQTKEIKELLEWLGYTGSAGTGLIYVYRRLRGKPPRKIEKIEEGKFKYTPVEGAVFTVPKEVNTLYNHGEIPTLNYYANGRVLEKKGIETVTSYLKGEEDEKTVLTEKDASYFRKTGPEEITDEEADETNESRLYVHLKRADFEESKQWSFRIAGTHELVGANIKDKKFMKRLRDREISLNAGDLLRIRLIKKQQMLPDGNIKTTNDIVEVLEYKSSPVQRRLEE